MSSDKKASATSNERPANDVSHDSRTADLSDEAALALVLASTAGQAKPLSKGLEEKLMTSFRGSRGRVGATTTAAGTQTVDLDELESSSRPANDTLDRRAVAKRRFAMFAVAATVLALVGAAAVTRLAPSRPDLAAGGAGVPRGSLTLARAQDGSLVVRSSDPHVHEPRTVWVHLQHKNGAYETLGSISMGSETTLPADMSSRFVDTDRLRLSASPSPENPLFEGQIPPASSK